MLRRARTHTDASVEAVSQSRKLRLQRHTVERSGKCSSESEDKHQRTEADGSSKAREMDEEWRGSRMGV
jgi:hypothetical protein